MQRMPHKAQVDTREELSSSAIFRPHRLPKPSLLKMAQTQKRESCDVRLSEFFTRAKDFERLLADLGGLWREEIETFALVSVTVINRRAFWMPRSSQAMTNHP